MLDIKVLPHSHSFASNTYLLSSDGECAVIDPAAPYNENLIDGKVKYIILTHAHFDHMLDIDEWVDKTGALVFVSGEDIDALKDPERNCYMLLTGRPGGYFGEALTFGGGDSFPLGDENIRVMATPGHTPGSVSLIVGDSIFVGDTIFAGGGYGKCCFPGGDFSKIRRSISDLISLDENIKVYPGHGEKTTIGEYKKDFLR